MQLINDSNLSDLLLDKIYSENNLLVITFNWLVVIVLYYFFQKFSNTLFPKLFNYYVT